MRSKAGGNTAASLVDCARTPSVARSPPRLEGPSKSRDSSGRTRHVCLRHAGRQLRQPSPGDCTGQSGTGRGLSRRASRCAACLSRTYQRYGARPHFGRLRPFDDGVGQHQLCFGAGPTPSHLYGDGEPTKRPTAVAPTATPTDHPGDPDASGRPIFAGALLKSPGRYTTKRGGPMIESPSRHTCVQHQTFDRRERRRACARSWPLAGLTRARTAAAWFSATGHQPDQNLGHRSPA